MLLVQMKMIAVYIYLLSRIAVYASDYDYIVVGSGSAGSVVARRLSEIPCIRVLLLEAGGGDPNLIAEIPLFSENLRVSPISWNYTTVPLKYAGSGLQDRISLVPRGKVLGGTSTINANLYTRGNKNDYDDWAAQGADGWDWKNVLPYFLKLEDNGDPDIANSSYHNIGGDQPINRPPFHSPIAEAYAKAAESLGYPRGDYNGETQQAFMIPQGTIKNGRRCSGLHCILNPIRGRENLTILTFAQVTKILIDENKKAYGVAFDRNNESLEATAKEEVILCAGVFNSAQLLMLSGIGPKKELEKLNIPVIADLPVGENLQDHPSTYGLLFEADTYTYKENNITIVDFLQFVSYGLGPLTSFAAVETIGFIKSKLAQSDVPDLEILWRTAIVAQNKISFMGAVNGNEEMWEALQPYSQLNVLQCFPYVLIPKSIGRMWLASADPYDSPLIDPNYYADENDTKVIVEGMKFCLEMAAQVPMKENGVEPIPVKFPGCESYKPFDDDYLACVAKTALVSFDHFIGTCKMGNPDDPTTVVDPSLRVKGISSLRVVDASIMPTIVSGHTHAAAAMIGEKGAYLILSDRTVCKEN